MPHVTSLLPMVVLLISVLCPTRLQAALDPGPPDCPSVCQAMACHTGVLTCPDGGLTQLPLLLPAKTSKVLLVNHRFTRPRLQQTNFSAYQSYQVSKLTIRNCSISHLDPGAFTPLAANLHTLDLSANSIPVLLPNTFSGLSLIFLRLDRNRRIQLQAHSFRGLTVKRLSLIDCELSILNYDSLSDLFPKLEQLKLTQNNLRVIDARFSLMFRGLTELELNSNPLDCSCDMRWLSQVLEYRRQRNPTVDGSSRLVNCASPNSVAGRSVRELTESDFVCGLPRLAEVDVQLQEGGHGARLRCVVTELQGEESIVGWWSVEAGNGRQRPLTPSHSGALAPNSSVVYVRRRHKQAGNNEIDNEEEPSYLCVARNRNGNSSAEIRFKWPPPLPPLPPSSGDGSINREQSTSTSDNSNVSQKQHPQSAMFRRQFTLLEMIGAVVGTFTATLLLFLLIYKFLVHQVRQRRHNHKRKLYETVLYSDNSQTYDIPHQPPYYPTTTALPPPTFHSPRSIPPPPSTPAHFLDFKNPPQVINNLHHSQHVH